jgi:hypothetical protein
MYWLSLVRGVASSPWGHRPTARAHGPCSKLNELWELYACLVMRTQ